MAEPIDQKSATPKDIDMVEHREIADDEMGGRRSKATMGTVTINDTEEIILVPAPSADPRGIEKPAVHVQFARC